jgi:hypothetical protein
MKATILSLTILTTAAAFALSPQETRECISNDREVQQVRSEIIDIIRTWPFEWTEFDDSKMQRANAEAASRAASCREYAEGLRGIKTRLTTYIRNGGPEGQRPQREDQQPRDDRPSPRGELPRNDRPRSAGPTILLLTDESRAAGAAIVERTFRQTPPFSCMDLNIVVVRVSPQELNCRPHSRSHNGRHLDRFISCESAGNSFADRRRSAARAAKVLIIVDHSAPGGSAQVSGTRALVTTAALYQQPKIGIHEFMHTLGFEDTYEEGQYSPFGGPIMTSTDAGAYVPQGQWSKIARELRTEVPANCGSAGRY